MKASKKVMESVIVSGLALTLAVTAVTGNGVNIAAKDAADTQFVNNGIAGVASAMNMNWSRQTIWTDIFLLKRQMRLWLRQQQMERLYPEMIQKKKKPQKRKLLPKRNRSGRIS